MEVISTDAKVSTLFVVTHVHTWFTTNKLLAVFVQVVTRYDHVIPVTC